MKPQRQRCERCQRPRSHCLCTHIPAPPIYNRTQILILQHPDEARHPLNTARLAYLGLARGELLIGESFPQLETLVAAAGQAWLLFPVGAAGEGAGPVAISPCEGLGEGGLLIVPDGTWRKARRIVRENPVLGTLPRISLPAGQPSEYRIRKARESAAVSTIEAIVRTLSMLEPEQDFRPLLKPFGVLIDQQIQAMGKSVFQRNY